MIDLKEPLTWPHIDLLPLKRDVGDGWPELGLLIAGQGSVVFLTNAYTPGLMGRLKSCERINYASFNDISVAGWVVD